MRFTDDLYENGLIKKVLQHIAELQPLMEASRLKECPTGDKHSVASRVEQQRWERTYCTHI